MAILGPIFKAKCLDIFELSCVLGRAAPNLSAFYAWNLSKVCINEALAEESS